MIRRELIEDLERQIDYRRSLPAGLRLALVRARNRLQAEEGRVREMATEREDWVVTAIRAMTAPPTAVRGDADAHVHELYMAAMGYRGDRGALQVAANRARALRELLDRGDLDAARRIAAALDMDLAVVLSEDGLATQETPAVCLHGKAV